jgi:large subunit ribosomal protein L25
MPALKATKRSEIGTRKVKPLRSAGQLPGIIYGHKLDAVAITLQLHEVELAIHHGERLLEVDVDGATENVLIKEIQYDTFGQDILHVDLARVDLDELVEVTVQIVLRGTPVGAIEGGVLTQAMAETAIECMVRDIPEEIRLSVTELKVGDSLHLRDLKLPEGAKLIGEPGELVCSVNLVAEEVEPAPAEGEETTQPEVIGAKPEEEDEEAS